MEHPNSTRRPSTVIAPPGRWTFIDLRELWRFRGLISRFTIRDLKLRYKQTALGVAWVVLQPLLSAGVFSFVFGRVADLPSDGVPYFVFAYAGMMSWTVFSSTLSKISGSLVGNAQLVSKVYFPRLALPASVIGSILVDLAVSVVVGVGVLAVGGVSPDVAILTFPLWILGAVLLGAGVGLISAALMVSYRDIAYILPVATQLLLYATPIAYSADAVPARYQWVVELNPLATIISGSRSAFIGTRLPSPGLTLFAALAAVLLFVAGASVFARLERRFADAI